MTNAGRYRHTFAAIHLGNLRHNCRALKELLPEDAFFCPMVKSNGYGHGDIEITRVLVEEGVQRVGVALVEEGIRLREHQFKKLEVLVFGMFDGSGADAIIQHRLTPVLSSFEQIDLLMERLKDGDELPIHIKFNTGMQRLGFEVEERDKVYNSLRSQTKLKVMGICTHLATGEDGNKVGGRTSQQLEELDVVRTRFSDLTETCHAFNSAGFLAEVVTENSSIFEEIGVRPGLALYGIFPSLDDHPNNDAVRNHLNLKPVMELRSEVAKIHRIRKGETVSYGGHWEAPRDSIIGVVPIGYADGYGRVFSNKGQMLYKNQKVPVRGAVCMDYVMIDLTDVLGDNHGRIGDDVLIFGSHEGYGLPVEEVAKIANTISYELLTCIGRRVPRSYING